MPKTSKETTRVLVENMRAPTSPVMTTAVPATDARTGRQLDLLRAMGRLDPRPCLFGGYAEDALLAGSLTRVHADVDWLVPRRELEFRLAQARSLGFTRLDTWGESAPGQPGYLSGDQGDLTIDIAVSDEIDGRNWLRLHRLFFEVDGKPAVAGYQIAMPDGMYTYPMASIEGIEVRVASPLALYQLRAGIAARGSFGPLSDRHRESSRQLRERFFPGIPEPDLVPRIEPLVLDVERPTRSSWPIGLGLWLRA